MTTAHYSAVSVQWRFSDEYSPLCHHVQYFLAYSDSPPFSNDSLLSFPSDRKKNTHMYLRVENRFCVHIALMNYFLQEYELNCSKYTLLHQSILALLNVLSIMDYERNFDEREVYYFACKVALLFFNFYAGLVS